MSYDFSRTNRDVQNKIYTIGHSTRKINNFIKILIMCKIRCLVDVRSYPMSRFVPDFNKENLKSKLAKYKIKYVHIPELGGRRRLKTNVHTSIQAPTYASYAEYMFTDDFNKGLDKLKKIGQKCRTAYMCAEALWWRCHRRLISDRLEYDGWEVYHLGLGEPKRHEIWDISRLDNNNQIIYDQ